jgi:glutamate-1-semialdehyde 2,1-aminomutase
MVEILNKQLFLKAKQYIAGGVNSPVRSFKATGGLPIFIRSAKGSRIYSEDGREFIDYCLSFGALILGHSHPKVAAELKKAIDKGGSFGTPTKLETELAKAIIKAIPSIQNIRLTNSGTEAVMGAIRLARAFTMRNSIIKFSSAYHGHADYLLDCPGIPGDFKKHTLTSAYNDIKGVEELFRQHKKDIAAIIVEPVAANNGLILPRNGFLEGLRKISQKYGSILIFDEVITGFRLSVGGAQEYFRIKPDLTCLGKIIGGGLPVGAFGGRKEIMQLLAPQGNVYQAGTFSGNPLTVSAGLATLRILLGDNPYLKLEEETRFLCENISCMAEKYRIKIKINFIGSMFSIDTDLFKRFYHGLLKEGIYFSPSWLEANFLSIAHSRQDIEKTLMAIEKIFKNSPA